MRALGIDFGEKRIGLALTDPAGLYALPWQTLERTTDRRAVYHIAALARGEAVSALVVGEPRRPGQGAGEPPSRARGFGAKLEKASGLPVFFIDECLTTVEASERLRAADADDDRPNSRGRAEGRRDQVAAQLILQEAIDRGLLVETTP